MNKGLIFFFGLAIGVGGGGFVANKILKQAYEQKSDDEITRCREAFVNELTKLQSELSAKKAEEKKEAAAEAIAKYSSEPEKAAAVINEADKPKEPDKNTEPYEITDEVFEDPANPYTAIGLTFFPNENVLLRADHSIMGKDDLDAAIGLKALSLFDDERDRVLIRNEKFKVDYEIVISGCSLAEWRKKYPDPNK